MSKREIKEAVKVEALRKALQNTTRKNQRQATDNRSNKNRASLWTEDEHRRFVEAIRRYGRDWQMVGDLLGCKALRVRDHFASFRN